MYSSTFFEVAPYASAGVSWKGGEVCHLQTIQGQRGMKQPEPEEGQQGTKHYCH